MGVAERDLFARPLIQECFILMMSRLGRIGFRPVAASERLWPVPGSQLDPCREGAAMLYKVKSVAALQTLLGGWPDRTRVEVDRDVGVSAKTVGELRKLTAWPANLAITTPPETRPQSTIKVSKATVATRVSPKT